MTTVSEPRTATYGAADLLSSVTRGLKSAFDANDERLRALANRLVKGEIRLTNLRLEVEPYIGLAERHMRELRWLAANGNVAAQREIANITRHHRDSRYLPLVKFLHQFPSSDAQLLLGTVRNELVGLELKLDRNGRVVAVVATRRPYLLEHSLRAAFRLKLQETIAVATWIRGHRKQLGFSWKMYMPPAQRNNTAVAGERFAKLTTFFDNSDFPEEMRKLLVAKAWPELTHLRFDIIGGDVVLRVESTQP